MRCLLSLLLCLVASSELDAHSRSPLPPPTPAAIGFGSSVAIAGDEILIGRPGIVFGFPMPPTQTGAVHVYRRGQGGRWTEVSAVAARGISIQDAFGASIAVEGNL